MDASSRAIQGGKRGIIMWLCKRDLSKECDGKYRDCTDCVLDKIRAEIEKLEYLNIDDGSDGYDKYIEQYEVLKIIDKYKAESEE